MDLATATTLAVSQAAVYTPVIVDAEYTAAVELVVSLVACPTVLLVYVVALVVSFQADAETRKDPAAPTAATAVNVL